MNQKYVAPSVTEWGTVADLTAGTGHTQFTDGTLCTTPGGVTFAGSSNASFCD
jgi:hypothetical protein